MIYGCSNMQVFLDRQPVSSLALETTSADELSPFCSRLLH